MPDHLKIPPSPTLNPNPIASAGNPRPVGSSTTQKSDGRRGALPAGMPGNAKRTSSEMGSIAGASPAKRRQSEIPLDARHFMAGLRKAAANFSRMDTDGFAEMPRPGELLKSADIPLSATVVRGITAVINESGNRIQRQPPSVPLNWANYMRANALRPETILVGAHYMHRIADKLDSLTASERPGPDQLKNITAAVLLLADKSHGPNRLGHVIHDAFREEELDPITEEPVLDDKGNPKRIYSSPQDEQQAKDLIAAEYLAFGLLEHNTTVSPDQFSHQIDRLEQALSRA